MEIFPVSGISKTKTLYCNENGYWFDYLSDRYGFNNPDDEWNNDKVDFLLIGDSLTMGACVNRPYDISSVLRAKTIGVSASSFGSTTEGGSLSSPKSPKSIGAVTRTS